MKAHKQLLLLLVAAATIFTGSAYGQKNHKINSKTEKEIIGYFSKTLKASIVLASFLCVSHTFVVSSIFLSVSLLLIVFTDSAK